MKGVAVFFCCCYISLLIVSTEAQERSAGVYIVYTGAALSSSADFDESNHILSSSSIESWKDRIIHTYTNGFSGFAAWLSEEEANSIAQRPEVVSVFPDSVLRLHTTRSWDFLKEQSAVRSKGHLNLKSSSSLSGQDVIIGILDTGIWPEAKSFNDKGLGPIPKKWKGKCIEGADFKASSCNRKLIGARNYVTSDNSTSARDYNGHGTHVAGIAAGRAVPGASYNGLARGTGQGGSPGSRIAVYRTCNDKGCESSTVLKAFDDAIADGVDVISLSFGTDFVDYTTDPIAIGSFHAVEQGILVVASAGSFTSDPESLWIQNFVPWILTVGATTMDRFFESDVVLGGNKVIKAGGIHSAKLKKNPVYPLIDGLSAKNSEADDSEAMNCFPGSLDASKAKGKIVVCETELDNDGEFAESGRHEVIVNLGGIGVIAIVSHGLVNSVYGTSPMVSVDIRDEEQILSYINSTRNPAATILPTAEVEKYKPAPNVAYFSGTAQSFPYLIKPDIAAPGVDILSAWPSNKTDKAFNILSGTSMACPHVSGIAALVKARYPSWSPSAIKSAIMTTASQTNNMNLPITNKFGDPATPYDYGAGEVTSLGPLQPGLVYETEIADYLHLLCNMGYSESRIKLISSKLPAGFSCMSNISEALVPETNYPSIVLRGTRGGTVVRTVTNVGDEEEEAVYEVSVEMTNKNIKVEVNPSKLHFTKEKKLSYQVTYSLYNYTSELQFEYGYGSITWSNEKYQVRIPAVAFIFLKVQSIDEVSNVVHSQFYIQ